MTGALAAGADRRHLVLGPGKLAESNATQVRAARTIVEALGLEIATPDDARRILELKGRKAVGF